jgi:hypothetical protein
LFRSLDFIKTIGPAGSDLCRNDTVGYEDKLDALGYILAAERRWLLPRDDDNRLMIQKFVGDMLVNDMASHL